MPADKYGTIGGRVYGHDIRPQYKELEFAGIRLDVSLETNDREALQSLPETQERRRDPRV